MTLSNSEASLLNSEVKRHNAVAWREYTFDINGEDFVLEGPLANTGTEDEPTLFDFVDDLTVEDIDKKLARYEYEQAHELRSKWDGVKFTTVTVGMLNSLTTALAVVSAHEGERIEVSELLAIDGTVSALTLATIGLWGVRQARKTQREADRIGKLAQNIRSVRPYFE